MTKRIVAPWKKRMGTGKGADRAYTARVERAIERGEYTPPPKEEKADA